MKKTYATVIAALCLLCGQAAAQNTVLSDLVKGTHFQAALGFKYQQIDFQTLNTQLMAEDYPALSEDIRSIGFLTQRISNNWVLSFTTFYSFTNEETLNRKEVEYRQQQWSLGAGYNVLSSEKLKLVPSLMATLGRNVLLVQDKRNAATTFQGLLDDPDIEAGFRNFSYLADVGLALHYQLFRKTTQQEIGRRSSWYPLILKAGYQFELGAGDFNVDGETVTGVPEIGLNGFYVTAYIGFGSKLLKD